MGAKYKALWYRAGLNIGQIPEAERGIHVVRRGVAARRSL